MTAKEYTQGQRHQFSWSGFHLTTLAEVSLLARFNWLQEMILQNIMHIKRLYICVDSAYWSKLPAWQRWENAIVFYYIHTKVLYSI